MNRRTLGALEVSAIGLGCMSMTDAYGKADPEEAECTLLRAEQGRDMRSTMPRFQGENPEKNLALVAELEALATSRGAAPGEVALAWLLAKGEHIVPIPGTKRRAYLEQNAAAAELALDAATLERLDRLFAPERVAGERYGMSWMRSSDTDD